MPVQRVANAELEAAIAEIETKNRVIGVERDGDGAFVIVYEPRAKRAAPGDKETR